ncbi:hypothetical protein F8388_006436 [Cannabis sativa]|uniref:FAR1 domain-containing protein n=1 Tax=Cannabis sativa TaxID=3483 RepID=A0A7J6HXX1_CANSA|nr:hypothetical protein F8388_020729 [Cannabis sativa]KAF4363930.1 hypothetical protein G4B88_004230 [Cannabis sativa]KAF4367128.1 hypothetical protein F8388_006436 [Cannabis sativa]KAF4400113.1 hypothetical protein G4B88_021327 [Cannabis sativa]
MTKTKSISKNLFPTTNSCYGSAKNYSPDAHVCPMNLGTPSSICKKSPPSSSRSRRYRSQATEPCSNCVMLQSTLNSVNASKNKCADLLDEARKRIIELASTMYQQNKLQGQGSDQVKTVEAFLEAANDYLRVSFGRVLVDESISLSLTWIVLKSMTDVDIASNSHWQEILDTLQLSKSVAEIDTHDIEGKEMVSLKMWEAFYYTYARWKGFSPRIDDTKSRKSDGEIYIRRWVCNKEGFRNEKFLNMADRKKRPKEITRCGCQAALRILRLQKTNLWRCQEFVPFHNHDLVIPSQMQFTRANREVPEAVAAQVISMNRCGIKTSSVVAHIALQSGGLDIRVIPESLILTRWRKDVKTSSSTQVGEHSSEHQKMTQLSRFGALNAYSNSMNFFASHSEATFQMAKMELEKLNTIFRASYEEGHNSQNSQPTTTYRDNPNIIQDPVRVRTKGMASTNSRKGTNDGVQGGRQCTLCGGRDHNKRTCMRRTGV